VSNYYAFAGAGELNTAAIGLLDSYLPQDDVEIVVPATMEAPGLIELYNWLNVEFTGIEPTSDIVDHLHALSTDGGNKVFVVLLRDDEHPENELLLDAYRQGISVLDLNDGLHPIEYSTPPEPPKTGGRRRKAAPEPGSEEALAAYQEASNDIREIEQPSVVEARIEGPTIPGPVWAERFEADGTRSNREEFFAFLQERETTEIEDELFGTLRELIRSLVAQEVKVLMSMTPGVRGTTENFAQTPPPEQQEAAADSNDPKVPYVLTKETGKYQPRGSKKGRPKNGTEIVYLTQSQVVEYTSLGLIESLSTTEISGQAELPFD
jgi:hypothetical protein